MMSFFFFQHLKEVVGYVLFTPYSPSPPSLEILRTSLSETCHLGDTKVWPISFPKQLFLDSSSGHCADQIGAELQRCSGHSPALLLSFSVSAATKD